MSFQFGQFRRNQLQSYLTPMPYTMQDVHVISELSSSITFVDRSIALEDSTWLAPTEADGIKKKNYFLRYRIYKKNNKQIFLIQLRNTDNPNNMQNLQKVEVDAGLETEYITIDVTIAPTYHYNQIVFILQREIEDYNIQNPDGTYGRKAHIEVMNLSNIYNVINALQGEIDNKNALLQIGVQSQPGLMMCINGEEIKVGRSGIYEIHNGYKIDFIGFILEPDDNRNFILDYQY